VEAEAAVQDRDDGAAQIDHAQHEAGGSGDRRDIRAGGDFLHPVDVQAEFHAVEGERDQLA